MKVVVVGGTGQLGRDVAAVFERDHDVWAVGHSDVEVADLSPTRELLESIRPNVVVNCAAFHRVDDCEDEFDQTFRVNAVGQANVARVCNDIGARCVFISTDYVFSGSRGGYTESDPRAPINVYGASKAAGEILTEQMCSGSVVARVSSLFGVGPSSKGRNFVETILAKVRNGEQIKVVDDLVMSPTFTRHAAESLRAVVLAGSEGIFHLANRGSCTWYEFAKAIVERAAPGVAIEPTSSRDVAQKARRPPDSSLVTTRLGGVGVAPKHWIEGLEEYLRFRTEVPA